MRVRLASSIIALSVTASCTSSAQQSTVARTGVPNVPVCELLKTPMTFSGKTVITTARITEGKHVTGIWDPACRELGADLYFSESTQSGLGIAELRDALSKSGLGDHPVVATLTGILIPNHRQEHSFLPQPRLVFQVSDASNIGRAKKVERR